MEVKIFIDYACLSNLGLGIEDMNVLTIDNSEDAMSLVDEAARKVVAQRSLFGAYQNRLEHTSNNLGNIVENTTAAESRIRDTDMADEMVKHSMENILKQAGQSMLAQANQTTNGVMSLLQ
ncbi:flagellin [Butyrivibrio sp. NC2002]|uniref:flagellin n=1 Tax=Butyrivibrio sp. NC2002 TaxID=1410610 RepID=UPI003FA45A8F